MKIEITNAQFQRTHREFLRIAGASGTTELVSGVFYFYSTELAVLRLLKAYRTVEKAHANFSVNLSTHYFRLETDFRGDMTTD